MVVGLMLASPATGLAAPEPAPLPKTQPVTLDDLFARLKAAEDDAEAKGVATLIDRRLDRSGSSTADLLTERARQAMSGRDLPLAIELLDRATTLEPGWSEGWNRRATVFWLLQDAQSAISDLKRTLVIEPRHYEAWAALGRIYQSLDDKSRALECFRRAAALYPRMPKLQTAIDRLAPDVDGREL
ncbi:MAG: tetratricopeptide repeat protein [Methylobacterium sp.]|uniref:tetratricopeptide repeat protein n=1 Tax=Methylobacterium sp. TaxID=409 RepID=UPI0025DDCFC7|nr:tetratricopeptide repeat protein [Methylobacterium sp.]MBX9931864.1 tetratricopeptide repeat protein [Methylobacterium sp.]